MISATTPITVEIEDRHLPARMVVRRLRRDLPSSGLAVGQRLRRRGALALIVAATSMLLPRLGMFRIRQGG